MRTQSFVHSTDPPQPILIATERVVLVDRIEIYNPNSTDVPFQIQLRARGPDDREMVTVLRDDSVSATDSWTEGLLPAWRLIAHSDPLKHDRLELVPDAAPTEPLHVTVFHSGAVR